MKKTENVSKFAEAARKGPVGPSLHAIIVTGEHMADLMWKELSDYAKSRRDTEIVDVLQLIFWPGIATVKIFRADDPKALVGVFRLRSVLVIGNVSPDVQKRIDAALIPSIDQTPIPGPEFGL